MAGKKIKLEKEATSEILVADTDSESGAQACDVEDYIEEEEEQQRQQASAEVELQGASSGRVPSWGPPQGRNTGINPFVGPAEGEKK